MCTCMVKMELNFGHFSNHRMVARPIWSDCVGSPELQDKSLSFTLLTMIEYVYNVACIDVFYYLFDYLHERTLP